MVNKVKNKLTFCYYEHMDVHNINSSRRMRCAKHLFGPLDCTVSTFVRMRILYKTTKLIVFLQSRYPQKINLHNVHAKCYISPIILFFSYKIKHATRIQSFCKSMILITTISLNVTKPKNQFPVHFNA